MKKILVLFLDIVLLTGCGKKDNFLGTWSASYELLSFGNITEKYEFKENGVCTRTLNAGTDIVEECTYEWNEDKTKIRILWDSKLNKDDYSTYSKISDNEIKIGEIVFTKQS